MNNEVTFPVGSRNKTTWPWVKSPPTRFKEDGKPLPKISIITPSYNQGHFIEETIRSILLQGYPNLEYIIIDGGSSDKTIETIKKYDPWITYWESESDSGQANAINKGAQRATGDIIQWINSDDYLQPGALWEVAKKMPPNGIVAFAVEHFGQKYTDVVANKNIDIDSIFSRKTETVFRQPGVWISRELFLNELPLNERLHYAFDWEFLLRVMAVKPNINYSENSILRFRHHTDSKTVSSSQKWLDDGIDIYGRLLDDHKFREWALDVKRILDELRWKADLISMRDMAKGHAFAKLLVKIALDPGTRLNRFSLGAARRILFTKSDNSSDEL